MLSIVDSFGLIGINGYKVKVEVDINRGLPSFDVVGLADTAIKESKQRVRSAIKNLGLDFPINKITINLAPADTKKEGSFYDLPIAIGILTATGQAILKNINLHIEPGKKIGVVGQSGVGKSTLANLLLRFYDPQDGAILIDGQNLKACTYSSVRQAVGIVNQENIIFDTSVRENITPAPSSIWVAQFTPS